MASRVLSVTEFKAKCLGLIEEIAMTGNTVTLTKRGRPVASVGPVRERQWESPEGAWAGKVLIADGDLTADRSGQWEVLRRKKARSRL